MVLNEKVAYEVALAASYTGKRSAVAMKQVVLNVASDPFMRSAYLGVKGGLLLVSADDPGPHSSQTEQDSRFFAMFAKIPVLDPSSPREAKEMVGLAFELSEAYEITVMLRLPEADLRRIRSAAAEAVGDPEAEVRMQVARALAQPSTPAEHGALGTLVGDRDVRVRINALRALAYPGAPLEPYLKRALLDRDRRVLRTVVEGLARVGGAEAEKVLSNPGGWTPAEPMR